jgi:hypothetical protein
VDAMCLFSLHEKLVRCVEVCCRRLESASRREAYRFVILLLSLAVFYIIVVFRQYAVSIILQCCKTD